MGGEATKIPSDKDAGEPGERIFEERSLPHSPVAASAVVFVACGFPPPFADILDCDLELSQDSYILHTRVNM